MPLWPHAIGDRRIGAVATVVLFAAGTAAAFVVPAAIHVVLSVYCLAGTWSVVFAVAREEVRGAAIRIPHRNRDPEVPDEQRE
ncbi:MAG: hypothetical protein AB7T14_01310 [Candidatus Methylacidiphilaceae bacterium]